MRIKQKTIRQYMFPESYPDNWELFKPPFPGGINEHMDHCFEKYVASTQRRIQVTPAAH
jgi:hypothetical protein